MVQPRKPIRGTNFDGQSPVNDYRLSFNFFSAYMCDYKGTYDPFRIMIVTV
jgi:hypothetical protein